MPSVTVENYLKHLLLLSEGSDGLVPMGALSAALSVVPGTVTTMVKALAAGARGSAARATLMTLNPCAIGRRRTSAGSVSLWLCTYGVS